MEKTAITTRRIGLPLSPRRRRSARRRHVFNEWVASRTRPQTLPPDRATSGLLSVRDLLVALRYDQTVLPATVGRALGVPTATTYGDAARLLWWACEAADGPRCRSYRAASYLVAGLDDDTVGEVLGRVRPAEIAPSATV